MTVPYVNFICPECKETLDWNKFDDGTPQCTCGEDMVVNYNLYEKETRTADEIIKDISDVLSESDGVFIEDIANKILSYKVTYTGDGFFELDKIN